MKRLLQNSVRRPAESDTTVLVLVGLVLILLLIVGGVGGLGMWQWMRAREAQRMAEMALMEAREAEMQARMQAERAAEETRRNLQQLRLRLPEPDSARLAHAGSLVAAPATSPWPLLSLLPVGAEEQR